MYAHARAKPKSLPCLDSDGDAIPFDDEGDCLEDENPAFNPINYHVPSSTSGIAHLPGSSVLIALGGWDTTNFVGTHFMQVSTTVHELGHNIGLYHGGPEPVWGNATTATFFEPQCKTNHLSVMNYLFQARGLLDALNIPHVDFSGAVNASLNET